MLQSQSGDVPVMASAEELLAAAVWAAVMVGTTPKQLNAIVFAGVRAAQADVGQAAGDMGEIKAYECALAAVKCGAGLPLEIGHAVKVIPDRGRRDLAERLRRASSRRNRVCHPDPTFERDIIRLFSLVEVQGAPTIVEELETDLLQEAGPAALQDEFVGDRCCGPSMRGLG